MELNAIAFFVSKIAYHTNLTADERAALGTIAGKVKHFAARRNVVRSGDTVHSACIVAEGILARTLETSDGRRQITAVYVPGEMPDLHALLMETATSNLYAISEAKVVQIARPAVRETVRQFPILMEALWREAILDTNIAMEWMANIGQRQAKARLAHLFAEMAVRTHSVATNEFNYSFPLTQSDLGEATGLSTVHINRSLQSLRAEKVLDFCKGRVTVRDWALLVRIADFDSAYMSAQPQRLMKYPSACRSSPIMPGEVTLSESPTAEKYGSALG